MAFSTYTITLTNGNVLAYVNPQTVDTTSSALTLIGQADLGYGVPLNENLVHLLENFANATPPASSPLQGQIWFDSNNNLLKFYDASSTWQPLATEAWVEDNFYSSSSADSFATESWVEAYVAAENFVTQTYLTAQGFLTSNQTITLSGDVTGAGATSIVTSLSANGVTAGTYDKVVVDATGRVTIGEMLNQQDVINALGYTPASVSGSSGQSLFSYGALGSSSGTVLNYLAFQSTNTNTNTLQLLEYRFANGSDWTTATTRIENITDVTNQGYIDFNPQNHEAGVAIGSSGVVRLVADASAGIYINDTLNVTGTGPNSPYIRFQTGSLNSNDTGFSSVTNLGLISYNQDNSTLYFSANPNGGNNVSVTQSGAISAIGLNGTITNVYMSTNNNTNNLSLDGNGNLYLNPSGTNVFTINNSGSLKANGTITTTNGNWYSQTNNNVNFWVNNAAGTSNLGVLWFDQQNGNPYSWRMTAQPGGGSASNQFYYDANGMLTADYIYTVANDDVGTGMVNYAATNLSLTVQSARRIVIGGFYDFENGSPPGSDPAYVSIPGDINLFFGEGNYGDGDPTNTTGDRRRLGLGQDGSMAVYALDDSVLWTADTAGSDLRLKQNVKTYSDGLKLINQLRPVTFEWKEGHDLRKKHGDTKQFGFIAQELEKIEGHNAVAKVGPQEYRVVHKQALVPHLVSAVQELATENKYLKRDISKLENRLSRLENILRQKFML